MLKIEMVTTTEGFRSLENEWNQLLAQSTADTIFLTWEWLYTWWEVYGEMKTLQILLAKDKGSLVGIAPLYTKEIRHYGFLKLQELHFLGTGEVCSDYLDFIVQKGRKQEVLKKFIEHLRKIDWERLVLDSVPENSTTIESLRALAPENGCRLDVDAKEECPYILLPKSWQAFLKSRSKKLRAEVRSDRRRLSQQGRVQFSIIDCAEDVQSIFETFIQQHQQRWEKIGFLGHFTSTRYFQFHRTIAPEFFKKGWLYLASLKVNGTIAAMQYNFIYNGKLYNYLPAFDMRYHRYSVGTILLSYCLEDLILRGVREFDFLRGDEPYKRRWADHRRSCYKTTLFLPCARTRLYKLAQAAEHHAKSQVTQLLPSSIIEDFRRLRKNRKLRKAVKQGNVR